MHDKIIHLMDERKAVIVAYLDFSGGLGIVFHRILLEKTGCSHLMFTYILLGKKTSWMAKPIIWTWKLRAPSVNLQITLSKVGVLI